ncbi:MAG TPA: hypothetical protein VHD62_08515 [Opitutaceae bacterium]|nr:hypothetical protein [Opitutaceae bacterium]
MKPIKIKLPPSGSTYVKYSDGLVQFAGMAHPDGTHTSRVVVSKSGGGSLGLSKDFPEAEKKHHWLNGFEVKPDAQKEHETEAVVATLISEGIATIVQGESAAAFNPGSRNGEGRRP